MVGRSRHVPQRWLRVCLCRRPLRVAYVEESQSEERTPRSRGESAGPKGLALDAATDISENRRRSTRIMTSLRNSNGTRFARLALGWQKMVYQRRNSACSFSNDG